MRKYWKVFPVLALILVLLAGCGKNSAPEPEQTDTEPDTETAEISELVCSNGSVTLRFARDENGVWYWFDDPAFPLDEERLTAVIDSLGTMEGRSISKNILANYGLDAPEKYIAVTVGEETTTYYVSKRQKDGCVYCNDQLDVSTIYEASEAVTDLMKCSIYDLAKLPQLPELTMDNIHAVKVVRENNAVALTVRDGKWLLSGKDVSAQVSGLADALSQLSLVRCVDYAPSKGAASICGLTKPAAVMTVTYGNSVGTESQLVLTIGDTYHDDRFALLDDDTTIYQFSADLAAPILSLAKNGI